MITIRDLTDRMNKLSEKLEYLPQFRWGHVTSTTPMAVVLDAETDPLTGVGTITRPQVGDRVLVLLWNRRATILGAAISGDEPPTSGVWEKPSSGWPVSGWAAEGRVWRGTLTLNLPIPIPANTVINVFPINSSGYTFVQTSGCVAGRTSIGVRVMQISNGDINALSQIGWQLIPL